MIRIVSYVCLSLFVVIADQISKWYISEKILRPEIAGAPDLNLGFIDWMLDAPARLGPIRMEILSNFNLVMVWNEGISFGMFSHDSQMMPLILMAVTVLIALVLFMWLLRADHQILSLGLALVIGGAVGNIIDRVRFHAVMDFFDVHVAGYHWPAFNIADSCISIGVIVLIIYTLFIDKSMDKTVPESKDGNNE